MFYWCLFIVFVPPEQPYGAAPLTLPILKASFPQNKIYQLSKLVRKSRVISKLSQLLAILGATLSKLGPIPLKRPRSPSSTMIALTASQTDVYW